MGEQRATSNLVVDWFRVIVDLSRCGYTNKSIAMAVGAGKSTVQGWKQGSTPAWDEGDRLICLWQQVMGKGRDHLPMINALDWRR